MNRTRTWFVFSAVASLLVVATGAAQAAWNPNDDFSIANGNPNGVWRYGYASQTGTTGTACAPNMASVSLCAASNHIASGEGAGLDVWLASAGVAPLVAHNPTASAINCWSGSLVPTNGILMAPKGSTTSGAYNGKLAFLAWTAPTTGCYNVFASFIKNQSAAVCGAYVFVYKGASQLYKGYTGTVNLQGVSYTGSNLVVHVGETIYFLVGHDYVPDDRYAPSVEFTATITELPAVRASSIPNDDFSITNGNPNGVWRYGYANQTGTTGNACAPNMASVGLCAASKHIASGDGAGLDVWDASTGVGPSVAHNPTASAINCWSGSLIPINGILMAPKGSTTSGVYNGKLAFLAWTAPRTWRYDVFAGFTKNQSAAVCGAYVFVYKGASQIYKGYTGTVNLQGVSYTGSNLVVNMGETIYFLVGHDYVPDDRYAPGVEFTATITPAPPQGTAISIR